MMIIKAYEVVAAISIISTLSMTLITCIMSFITNDLAIQLIGVAATFGCIGDGFGMSILIYD